MDYIPKYLDWKDVENLCMVICNEIRKDKIKFDVVVPVIKGGFFLSNLLFMYIFY